MSRLLTKTGTEEVAKELGLNSGRITDLSLHQFDTEEQFAKRVKGFFEELQRRPKQRMLFIQAEVSFSASETINLIECSRYLILDVMRAYDVEALDFKIVFLLHIPRVTGGCFNGLSVRPWISCHIDELRKSEANFDDLSRFKNLTIAELFETGVIRVDRLVIDCLPKAASLVASDRNANRIQQRIDILMNLVEKENDAGQELLRLITEKVVAIRKNQEGTHEPNKWLVRMAIDNKHMKEGNTFQKSITLHLADQIIDILKVLIAFLDRNHGLDIIHNEDRPEWIWKVYLEIFRRINEIRLIDDLDAFCCFKGRFPFSRYLIDLIESWFSGESGAASGLLQLQTMCESNDRFGELFEYIFDRPVKDALEAYLIDFNEYKFFAGKTAAVNDDVKELILEEMLLASKRECELRIQELEVGGKNNQRSMSPNSYSSHLVLTTFDK